MTGRDLRWGAATHPGRIRDANEDAFAAEPGLFLVADGMGGHQAGEVASALAIETLSAGRDELLEPPAVVALVRRANEAILERARVDPATRGMGTTLTGIVTPDHDPSRAMVLNVGDSRTYRWRSGALEQITVDHSYVQDLLASGMLSPEEARTHPRRNIVTRALGVEADVTADVAMLDLVPGDRYVVCSDGLVDELTDTAITELLARAETDTPQTLAERLVDAAVEHGGRDNVTVVVLDVGAEIATGFDADSEPDPPEPPRDDEPGIATEVVTDGESSSDPDPDRITRPDDQTADPDAISVSAPSRPRPRWQGRLLALAVVAASLGLAIAAVGWYARSGYYVDVEQDRIVIRQGREGGIWWFDTTRERVTDVVVADLTLADLERVTSRPRFDSADDAETFVRGLPSVTQD